MRLTHSHAYAIRLMRGHCALRDRKRQSLEVIHGTFAHNGSDEIIQLPIVEKESAFTAAGRHSRPDAHVDFDRLRELALVRQNADTRMK